MNRRFSRQSVGRELEKIKAGASLWDITMGNCQGIAAPGVLPAWLAYVAVGGACALLSHCHEVVGYGVRASSCPVEGRPCTCRGCEDARAVREPAQSGHSVVNVGALEPCRSPRSPDTRS